MPCQQTYKVAYDYAAKLGFLSQLTHKTLLLLRFKLTNQGKADDNTCNGLLK
jgi:hypothetical protein